MENKSVKKGIIIGICSTWIVVIVLFSMGTFGGLFTINGGVLMRSSQSEEEKNFEERVVERIRPIMKIMDSYYLEDYDEDDMIDGLLSGMLAAVGDPYTGYYNEESYEKLMETSTGVYYGIGVVVQQDVTTGAVLVVNPYADCPGAEAGMLPGDIIYSVGDVEVTGMDLNEVVALIRGAEGSTVDITVLHENAKELTTLTVERRKIETHTVEYDVLEGDIGYVKITEFDSVTTSQFVSAMEDLKSQNIKSLIVDLRDNPGGSLETVIDVLDTLLPKGIYTYLEDKYGNRQNYKGRKDASYEYPMVVLVNGNSASASELFTGAVHDYGKATIVGTTTFGKGIVQQIIPLKDGGGVKVTMAKYYTPNGVCIHKTGITPDVTVELDDGEYASTVEREDDEQLKKAVEILKSNN